MQKLCVINAVGLTPRLAAQTVQISSLGKAKAWKSPLPAVTCTAQATMLTGMSPAQHGIVGNGWLFRDTGEVRFWQQSNALIQGEPLYKGVRSAQMFWWFNQGADVEWYATPKPHYGSDGSKQFGILDRTGCALEAKLGPFPFPSFWGPKAGLPSSDWIARASALVLRQNKPDLTLVYLPHLDYDYQRVGPGSLKTLMELDAAAGHVIEAAREIGAKVVVVSEYGLVPVSRPVYLNQALRRAGWLQVRDGPYGERLETFESKAFAVVDHQLAHVYVRGLPLDEVRRAVEKIDGVDRVVEPKDVELDHPRSGELIALAKPDAWFAYPYWLDEERAPDFARTVDIHRKPGYDPCELFLTSAPKAAARLLQKKLGFRYRMDVIPLDASLVKGSHGLRPAPDDGPAIVGENAPDDMKGFKDYVRSLLT
ncbi:MAG TPA: nucleotide pyrophosphatase/phosphodiesterase family protein [Planctomycetota bacterium]|nr:nucleotide pyrophosphatase/phosphodiesterase family protein [Planctomycetota bacterium]